MTKCLCKDSPCLEKFKNICCRSCPDKHECGDVCDWVSDNDPIGDCGNLEEVEEDGCKRILA